MRRKTSSAESNEGRGAPSIEREDPELDLDLATCVCGSDTLRTVRLVMVDGKPALIKSTWWVGGTDDFEPLSKSENELDEDDVGVEAPDEDPEPPFSFEMKLFSRGRLDLSFGVGESPTSLGPSNSTGEIRLSSSDDIDHREDGSRVLTSVTKLRGCGR